MRDKKERVYFSLKKEIPDYGVKVAPNRVEVTDLIIAVFNCIKKFEFLILYLKIIQGVSNLKIMFACDSMQLGR
jgi:hypothetical protein